ncbi:glutathione S-transferase U8-like [Quercus robur]|uniref:glutathione S-transferase U8-like n=1 Tax=Quercus robur TaxID=38942 RepID=UPI002162A1A9|nr:glutathione S-transferase U8-like [Quercus robur]
MAEEVLVFGAWGSPFSRRVEMALKLKGIEYKYIEEDITNKSPSLLKYNPVHKKIPVLVHNGKAVAESLVILEYIDETWKDSPILSKDPYERANARFWAKFIDEKCLSPIFKACWGEEKEHEKALEEASELLQFLENELKEKRYFGGETVGLLDIAANIIGYWLGVFEEASGAELLTREKFPKLCNWANEFVSVSAIKENLPPREKLIAYFRNRFGVGATSK